MQFLGQGVILERQSDRCLERLNQIVDALEILPPTAGTSLMSTLLAIFCELS